MLIAAGTLVAGACLPIREAITSRHDRGQDTPELDCIQIIDHTFRYARGLSGDGDDKALHPS